jgi:hypothetical protein
MAQRQPMTSASMTTNPPTHLYLIERIERALLLLAYFIELDGDVHVPMYEKLEAELTELKAVADVKARARQRLETYKRSGDGKAINSRNLSFNSSEGPLPYLGL